MTDEAPLVQQLTEAFRVLPGVGPPGRDAPVGQVVDVTPTGFDAFAAEVVVDEVGAGLADLDNAGGVRAGELGRDVVPVGEVVVPVGAQFGLAVF